MKETDALLIWKNIQHRNVFAESALERLLSLTDLKRAFSNSLEEMPATAIQKRLAKLLRCESADEAFLDALERGFLKVIHGIRLFHGCRPVSLQSYLTHGIVKADQSKLEALAREIWISPKSSRQYRATVEQAIASFGKSFTEYEKRVFLAVDDRFLLAHAGHYLINGSEYLQGIAARVGIPEHCGHHQELLRNRGIPTMLICDIPTSEIRRSLRELWRVMTLDYVYDLSVPSTPESYLDYCVTVEHVLAERIMGHYHPSEIQDPHSNAPYHPSETVCDFCNQHGFARNP